MKEPELKLERRAARLQGEVLERVLYQQLSWSAEAGASWSGSGPHPVERAVYLQSRSGRRFRVSWADELGLRHGFGVAIDELRSVDADLGPLHEGGGPWAALLGRRVVSSRVHWREIEKALRPGFGIMVAIHADHLSRRDYPATLELGLDGGASVFIAAARLLEDGSAIGFCNHLLVLFDRGDLVRLGLC